MTQTTNTDGAAPRDLGTRFDAHMAAEFAQHDADATMTTMVDEPVVLHVPTSIGGRGHAAVHRFYPDYFVNAFPPDFEVVNLSRTIGEDRLVDEMIVRFTHTCEMPIFLPGSRQQEGASACHSSRSCGSTTTWSL